MEILPSLHEFIAGSPQALFHPHGAHLARLARRVAGARPRGATMLQWSGSTGRQPRRWIGYDFKRHPK